MFFNNEPINSLVFEDNTNFSTLEDNDPLEKPKKSKSSKKQSKAETPENGEAEQKKADKLLKEKLIKIIKEGKFDRLKQLLEKLSGNLEKVENNTNIQKQLK